MWELYATTASFVNNSCRIRPNYPVECAVNKVYKGTYANEISLSRPQWTLSLSDSIIRSNQSLDADGERYENQPHTRFSQASGASDRR
jgi:hypothetical protein